MRYIHSLCELHIFCKKYLGLNNVTNVFHNVIQFAPLDRETINIEINILKDFDLFKF